MADASGLEQFAVFFISFIQNTYYHCYASATLLVYDYLTTLDDEVEYVWGSANKLPKFLYFISRYVGLFAQVFLASPAVQPFCPSGSLIPFVFLTVLVVSVELGLMLRIDALYGCSRLVRGVMGVAFVAEVTGFCVLNILSLPFLYEDPQPLPAFLHMAGCLPTVVPPYYRYTWIPTLAFETLMFGLNTFKCASYDMLDVPATLLVRLFRDGSTYFAMAFGSTLLCMLANVIPVEPVITPSVIWTFAAFSYAGCHLLISMRKVGACRLGLPTLSMSAWADADADVRPLPGLHTAPARARAGAGAGAGAHAPAGLGMAGALMRRISGCFGCGERDKRQGGEHGGVGIELAVWGEGQETELETESQTKTEPREEAASLAFSSSSGREYAHVHPSRRWVPEG